MPSEVTSEILPDDPELSGLAEAVRTSAADDAAWSSLESWASRAQNPDPVSALYHEALARHRSGATAEKLEARALRFHEEWFEESSDALLDVLRHVVARDPGAEEAFQRLTVVLTSKERWADLLALYDSVIDGTKERDRKLSLLEEAVQTARDFASAPDAAIRYLQQTLALSPADAAAAQSLEKLLEKRERFDDLVALLRDRLDTQTDTDARATRLRIAELLLERVRDLDAVVTEAEALVTVPVTRGPALVLLEKVLGDEQASKAAASRAAQELAKQYEAVGDRTDLVRVLRRALELSSESTARAARIALVDALEADGASSAAFDELVTVVRHTPGDTEARTRLVALAPRAGRDAELLEVLESLANDSADDALRAAIRLDVARLIESREGDTDGTVRALERVLEERGTGRDTALEALHRLAEIHGRSGRATERLDALERRVGLITDEATRFAAWAEIARSATDAGLFDRAIDAWSQCLEIDPRQRVALDAQIALLDRAERYEDLVVTLRRRIASLGESVDRRVDLVRVARLEAEKLGRKEQAVETWRLVADAFGEDVEVVDALCALYVTLERDKDLAELLARAEDREGAHLVELRVRLADLLRTRLGEPERAVVAYRRALDVAPSHEGARAGLAALADTAVGPQALEALASLYAQTGEASEELALLEPRLAAADSDARRVELYKRAIVLAGDTLGDEKAALAYAASAFVLAPADRGLEGRLATLSKRTGTFEPARAALTEGARKLTDDPERRGSLLEQALEIARTELRDTTLAFEAALLALAARPRKLALAEDVLNLGGAAGRADEAEAALFGLSSDPSAPNESVALLVSLRRPRGDASTLEAVERLLARTPDDLALLEEARALSNTVGDAARAHAYAVRSNDRAVVLLRRGDTSSFVADTARKTLEVKITAAMEKGDPRAALSLLLEGATLPFPTEERLAYRRRAAAIANEELGDRTEAIEALRGVLRDAPEDAEAAEALARLLAEESRHAELLTLRRASLTKESQAEARLERRLEIVRLLEAIEAQGSRLDALRANLAESPGHAATIASLERLLSAEGRHAELASILAEQADRVDASASAELFRKVSVLATEKLRDDELALTSFRRLVELEPSAEIFDALASILGGRGDATGAARWLERRLQVASDAEVATIALRLVAHLEAAGRKDRAVEVLESAHARDPGDARVRELLAAGYRARDEHERLAALLFGSAAHAPTDEEKLALHREVARLRFDVLGRPADAVASLAEVARLAPDDRAQRARLAEAYTEAGALDEATATLTTLVEEWGRRRSPERAALHFQLAGVLRRKGDLPGAIDQLELATQMAVSNAPMLLELGRACREANQLDRAEKTYRTLLVLLRRRGSDDPVDVGVGEVSLALFVLAEARGESDKAEELLQSAQDAAQASDAEALRFAEQAAREGRHKLATTALEKRLGQSEAQGEPRAALLAHLADALVAEGRAAEGLARRLQALSANPEDVKLYRTSRAEAKELGLTDVLVKTIHAIRADAGVSAARKDALGLELVDVLAEDRDDVNGAASVARSLTTSETEATRRLASVVLAKLERRRGNEEAERAAHLAVLELGDLPQTTLVATTLRLAEIELGAESLRSLALARLRDALGQGVDPKRVARLLVSVVEKDGVDSDPFKLYDEVARASGDAEILYDVAERRANAQGPTTTVLRAAADRALALGYVDRAIGFLERIAARTDEPEVALAAMRELVAMHSAAGNVRGAIDVLTLAKTIARDAEERRGFALELAALASGEGGDVHAAIDAYRELALDTPTDPAVYEPLFALQASLDDDDGMLATYEQVMDAALDAKVRCDARMARARFLAGKEGREPDAVDLLKDALSDDPSFAEASALLTELYGRSGYDEELVELLRTQLDHARDRQDEAAMAELTHKLGALLARVDRDAAIDVYRAALDDLPLDRSMIESLLALLGPEHDVRDRVALRERLLGLADEADVPRLALAVSAEWEALEDEDAARRTLETGLARKPDDVTLRTRLEAAYRAQDDAPALAALLERTAPHFDDVEERRARRLEAARLYRDRLHEPARAVVLVRDAVSDGPFEQALLDELLASLDAAGDIEGALTEISAALENASNEGARLALLRERARRLLAAARAEDAVRDLEAAYAISAHDTQVELTEALAIARAEAQSDRDVERERRFVLRLVDVRSRAGELSHARDVLADWTSRVTDDVESLERLRDIELTSENWPGVLVVADRLSQVGDAESRVEMALLACDACDATGQTMRARAVLERTLEAVPRSPRLLDRLRAVYEAMGAHRELAQMLLDDAQSESDPEQQWTLCMEAGRVLQYLVQDPEAALVPLDVAHRLKPEDHRSTLAYVDALIAANRHSDAGALLERVFASQPKRRTPELSQLQHRMARLARAAGDRSLDMQWMVASLECDKNNVEVAAELAHLAMDLNEHETALNALRAITLARSDGPMSRAMAFLWQARIAYQRGEARRAILWARKARQEDPNLGEAETFLRELGDPG